VLFKFLDIDSVCTINDEWLLNLQLDRH